MSSLAELMTFTYSSVILAEVRRMPSSSNRCLSWAVIIRPLNSFPISEARLLGFLAATFNPFEALADLATRFFHPTLEVALSPLHFHVDSVPVDHARNNTSDKKFCSDFEQNCDFALLLGFVPGREDARALRRYRHGELEVCR